MNTAATVDVKVVKWQKDNSCTLIIVSKHGSEENSQCDGLLLSKMKRNSLLLQDGEYYQLCNDKAVWVHHAILSTYLSCTDERWDHLKMDDLQFLWQKPEHIEYGVWF